MPLTSARVEQGAVDVVGQGVDPACGVAVDRWLGAVALELCISWGRSAVATPELMAAWTTGTSS